jgi:hypothetical protein
MQNATGGGNAAIAGELTPGEQNVSANVAVLLFGACGAERRFRESESAGRRA